MRIVLVGETNQGSRTPQRLRGLGDLGHAVAMVSTTPPGWSYETPPSLAQRLAYRLRLPLDPAGANLRLLEAVAAGCDVLLLDNARMIRPETLRAARRVVPAMRLVWYSEDDTMNPVHRTRWLEGCIPQFDLWVTTKSFNAASAEVPSLGARRVLFVDNSFCPHTHAPLTVTDEERRRWGAEISFVGTYEEPRAADLRALAEAGFQVRVWGNGWWGRMGTHSRLTIEGMPVYDDDYRKVVAASAINLCFLRKGNRDLQTCRSLELPAMEAFMMHERNGEMTRLFAPDREVAFFSDTQELIEGAGRWLADGESRLAAAAAARRRVLADGHSHPDRWRQILDAAMEPWSGEGYPP